MNVLANAMRTKGVQELRFLFCSKSPQSAGVRDFLKDHYPSLKAELPKTPILIREAPQQQPVVIARFSMLLLVLIISQAWIYFQYEYHHTHSPSPLPFLSLSLPLSLFLPLPLHFHYTFHAFLHNPL